MILAHHLGEGLVPALAAGGAAAAPLLLMTIKARLSRIGTTLARLRLRELDLEADVLPLESGIARLLCPDPACSRPAVIEDWWTRAATDGLAEMVQVRCEGGCWHTMLATDLVLYEADSAEAVGAASRSSPAP